MNKRIISAVAAAALVFSMSSAEARFGGFSHSSSHSSYHSSFGHSSSSGSTFGGGHSIGMSRSNVMSSVRNGGSSSSYRPSYSAAPAPSTTVVHHYYYGSTPSYAYGGHSTGALVGAAVAGGLVGYMLHRDSYGNVYYTNPSNPGIAYNAQGQAMQAIPQGNYQDVGVVGQQGYGSVQQPSSGHGLLYFLLALGLIGAAGAAYFIFRRGEADEKSVNYAPMKTPEEKLRDEKDRLFVEFQKHNCPSGIGFVRDNSDAIFFDAVKDMVMSGEDGKNVSVRRIESEVVDIDRDGTTYVASVRYRATVVEDDEQSEVDEVWHYKYINGMWKIAGIEETNE